jgi:hypothetical protein
VPIVAPVSRISIIEPKSFLRELWLRSGVRPPGSNNPCRQTRCGALSFQVMIIPECPR